MERAAEQDDGAKTEEIDDKAKMQLTNIGGEEEKMQLTDEADDKVKMQLTNAEAEQDDENKSTGRNSQ